MLHVPGMGTAITLEALAQLCGVHPTTVSRILQGGGEYRRPSYARRAAEVRSLAEKHGYRPNAAARAMVSRRFGAIALVQHADQRRSYLPQDLLHGIADALDERDLRLIVERCPAGCAVAAGNGAATPAFLRELHADGLLLNVSGRPDPALRQLLRRWKAPAVWLNAQLDADCVFPDDHDATRQLTAAFLAEGLRDVRYLGLGVDNPLSHYSVDARCAGHRQAMQDAGLEPRPVLLRTGYIPNGPNEVAAAFGERRPAAPQAWVAYSRRELEELLGLAHRLGLRPGSDIILAACSDRPVFGGICRRQMIAPLAEMGRLAVAMLHRRMASPSRTQAPCRVPWTMLPQSPS